MRIASAFSTHKDSREAVREAVQQLVSELKAPPDFLVLASTVAYDIEEVTTALHEFAPKAAIHGSTSSRAVMTEDGFHSQEYRGLSLLGLRDREGSYGTGYAEVGNAPEQAGMDAALRALEDAGRPAELPNIIWLTTAPGQEEKVIAGIEKLLGKNVPIIGGTAADDSITGDWMQVANDKTLSDGVVVSVLFPSTSAIYAFYGGYETTEYRGVVTAAEGRTLKSIDHRPAQDVYTEWSGISFQTPDLGEERSVVSKTTMFPLGRKEEIGHQQEGRLYLLSHARAIDSDGSIHLFTEVEVGDEVTLMRGNEEDLAARAGGVVRSAMDLHGVEVGTLAGGLIIFCAGCMHAIEDRGPQIVDSITDVLKDKPFMGTFTFGEQGCFHGEENHHGNLMVSVLLFGKKPPSMSPL